jgi:hypothetical protein
MFERIITIDWSGAGGNPKVPPFFRRLCCVLAGLVFLAVPALAEDSFFDRLRRDHPNLESVFARADELRLQVLVGRIETDAKGQERLVKEAFRVDAEYFYPASSIKLPAAVAALETLARLRRSTGLPLDEDTPLVYHPLFPDEQLEDTDPSHRAGGTITVAHEVRKLFLVSDNIAYNRLYELAGPDGLRDLAERAGLQRTRIVHRLSEARSAEDNRRLPRIDFRLPDEIYTHPQRTAPPQPPAPKVPGLPLGKGFQRGDTIDPGPTDFSGKNRTSLADLQRLLVLLLRPELLGEISPFRLTEAHHQLLLEAMEQLPRESKDPRYDPAEYPDPYVKFFLPGLRRLLPPERLRICNKIGQAYGFTTENAYIQDRTTGRAFFLAATLYTNENGILNDDRYGYTELAEPFLADLGEAVARTLWPLPD